MATYIVIRHEKGKDSVVLKGDGTFYRTTSLHIAKEHAVLMKSTYPENEYSISKISPVSSWRVPLDSRYTTKSEV